MDLKTILAIKNATILVVGDLMLDHYTAGDVDRISPEAPVPILNVTREESKLGGAGNVVNNICALSAKSRVLACIGTDEAGETLYGLLQKSGADLRFLMRSPKVGTITKTRIVAKNQQVIRIDREDKRPYPVEFLEQIKAQADILFENVDVVIFSDYGKGTLTEAVSQLLIREAAARGVPVLVDPKGNDWKKYTGATICTPNLNELIYVSGMPLHQEMEREIGQTAHQICKEIDLDYVLVTRSEYGMSLISREGTKADFPAQKKEVTDVSGAGDTVISMFALCMAAGFDIASCCRIANVAAGIVVSKFGTATANLYEVLGAEISATGQKIVPYENVSYLADYLHAQRKRIVFTNGCFDLIHAGHIYSLEQAHALGDILIVGINSDSSVRRLKGNDRPIISEMERAYLVQSLCVVDYVVVFEEDTPQELIGKICPNVLVKGQDYLGKAVAGQDVVEQAGGRVELIEMKPGCSTTAIIERICSVYQNT